LFFDPKVGKQGCGYAFPFRVGLAWLQHNLEFEKFAKPLNLVDVDAGLPNKIKRPNFSDYANPSQRRCQDLEQNPRICRASD
jgi:hypothetical protein